MEELTMMLNFASSVLRLLVFVLLFASPLPAQYAEKKRRIQFKPGATSATVRGTCGPREAVALLFRARKGQRIRITERVKGDYEYYVADPSGGDLTDADYGLTFRAPETGDYSFNLDCRGLGVRYVVTVAIR
jgi:hypothetical protein